VIDMTDPKALRALIEQEKPDIIVPEIEAIATEVLVEIESQGFAMVVPSARAVQLTMNREGIRRLAAEELKLPTSPYAFASSYAELEAAANSGIGFPSFIKPVMSSSGKGQSRVDRLEDLEAAWNYAASAGRVKGTRVIIEGMIEFDYEITLLTVRALGEDGMIETHFCDPIGHVQVKGDYVESWQPQPMSDKVQARAKEIAEAVTSALGGRGLFGVELFVKGQEVWFSEVSPRPHDTGMVTMATQAQNEFELHVRAILGLPVGTRMRRPGASAVIYGGVEAEAIRYENVDAALRVPESQLRLFGKPVAYERRRMGVALATADNVETARKRAKECAAKVRPVG
ncbi:MAG: formate-dependent phosphoribosylglycinamide formyltransferase, partial [Pseudomonadota bacterium]